MNEFNLIKNNFRYLLLGIAVNNGRRRSSRDFSKSSQSSLFAACQYRPERARALQFPANIENIPWLPKTKVFESPAQFHSAINDAGRSEFFSQKC